MICFEFFNWETVRCVTGSFPSLKNAIIFINWYYHITTKSRIIFVFSEELNFSKLQVTILSIRNHLIQNVRIITSDLNLDLS